MVPGRPYSFVAALESGRTSWTATLDVVRQRPWDDEIAVTAGQVREVIQCEARTAPEGETAQFVEAGSHGWELLSVGEKE
ncbi:hypothetical protein GCM10010341_88480 [Streptomyces noursei]|nr:hypothetical protein GCM10010341_88480 [Streptomyces noursei]